jgi:hypothetical protein
MRGCLQGMPVGAEGRVADMASLWVCLCRAVCQQASVWPGSSALVWRRGSQPCDACTLHPTPHRRLGAGRGRRDFAQSLTLYIVRVALAGARCGDRATRICRGEPATPRSWPCFSPSGPSSGGIGHVHAAPRASHPFCLPAPVSSDTAQATPGLGAGRSHTGSRARKPRCRLDSPRHTDSSAARPPPVHLLSASRTCTALYWTGLYCSPR